MLSKLNKELICEFVNSSDFNRSFSFNIRENKTAGMSPV